jgi:fibronectin type III domain protein
MRSPIRFFCLLSLALALPALAQLPPFGNPFPLADTRYGSASGRLILRTDGRDPFVFWTTPPQTLYATKLATGERHVGRPVLDATSFTGGFDAAWAGDHFLVANTISKNTLDSMTILGRTVDRNGSAIGEPFTLLERAYQPHLAVNSKTALLLSAQAVDPFGLQVLVLDQNGHPLGAPQFVTLMTTLNAVAANSTRTAAVVTSSGGTLVMIFDENGHVVANRSWLDGRITSAMASDGSRFLAVGATTTGVSATLLDANGAQLRTFALDGDAATVVVGTMWTGSKWIVAYTYSSNGTKLKVVELNGDLTQYLSRDQSALAVNAPVIAVNSRLVTATPTSGKILASDLPVAPERTEEVGFAAANQTLLATAQSADATLAVWSEVVANTTTIHSGLRTRDGVWRERELGPGTTAIAASNGREFVVIVDAGKLIRLNERGVPSPGDAPPLGAGAIGWNGQNYGVFGGGKFALLSPAGTWSTPVTVQISFPYYTNLCAPLASDGSGFFTSCYTPAAIQILGTPPNGVAGIRLDGNGQVLDAFAFQDIASPFVGGAAWDGRRYAMGWRDGTKVKVTYAGSLSIETRTIAEDAGGGVTIGASTDGVYAGWWDTASQFKAVFIKNTGEASTATVVAPAGASSSSYSALQKLTDGSLLRIYSTSQSAAPHYGSMHVMSQAGTFALPSPPSAPRLSVSRQTQTARLEWTAPSQRVDRYRVEYSVRDGLWLEMDTSFDSDRRDLDFPIVWPDATYSFRVRAVNEGGSTYSNPVTIMPMKRRAVR